MKNTLTSGASELIRTPRSNTELMSDLYDAFGRGDVKTATDLVTPDFVLHVPGRGLNAGEYWGPDGLQRFMSNIAQYNGGVFDLEVPVCSISGDHAFTRELIRINQAHDPATLWTLRIANWFELRNGQVSEAWVVPEDQLLYDKYWTPRRDSSILARRANAVHVRKNPLNIEAASSPANLQFLTKMYESFWRGDGDRIRRLIANDVSVNIVGQSAMSGHYVGWNGYMAFRDKLMAMAGDKYKLSVVAMAASPHDAWAVEFIRMNRRWDPVVMEIWVLMHFEIENGKIVAMDDFPLNTYQWEHFYTPPSI